MERTKVRTEVRDEVRVDFKTLYNSITDRFYYDEKLRPNDVRYEWKKVSVMGQEDFQYQGACNRTFWKSVPASRHPEVRGDIAGETIIIGGLMLMERPEYLCQQAEQMFYDEAIQTEANNREKLKLPGSQQHMPRMVNKMSRSYEASQSIPE